MLRLLIAGATAHEEIPEEIRNGLVRIATILVTREVVNAEEALQQLEKDTFDLLLLDMDISDGSGIDLIKSVKEYQPALPIIIFIKNDQAQIASRALAIGISGCVVKGSDLKISLAAIQAAVIGEVYVDPVLTGKVTIQRRDDKLYTLLTVHEFTVFLLLGVGKSVDQITEELFISTEEISGYKMNIMKKMGLKNIEDLIRYAVQHGFTD